MKLTKYVLMFLLAFCIGANISQAAPTISVQFVGAGSSALFVEMGQSAATQAATSTNCYWSKAKDANFGVNDSRPSPAVLENGQIWVTWTLVGTSDCTATMGTTINVYAYVQTDSVVGDKCFFANPQCTLTLPSTEETGGTDLLLAPSPAIFNATLPGPVQAALNGKSVTAAGTDIRPEDAKFASKRMFTACGTTLTREPFQTGTYSTAGLGYQGTKAGIGIQVKSSFDTSLFNVLDFNLTGTDPITGKTLSGVFAVTGLGAQPMMITVSGVTPGSGILKATDISRGTLAQFLDGTLGRVGDIVQSTDTTAVETVVREPLSGTYNTTEYSIPNTLDSKTSQEAGNCSGTAVHTNPLNLNSANGKVAGATRQRAIGTSQMVKALAGTVTTNTGGAKTCGTNIECLGYFFWSTGNSKPLIGDTHAKYITVDGVDPILTSYSTLNGAFPTSAQFGDVTFANLAAGDYAIWSVLRLVSTSPVPAGVSNVATAVGTHNSSVPDLIKVANLNILHSHFAISSIGIANPSNGVNGSCTTAEHGGDAGGLVLNKQADSDFCSDNSNTVGKVNLNQ